MADTDQDHLRPQGGQGQGHQRRAGVNVARFEGGPIDGAALETAWPPPAVVVTSQTGGKYVLVSASRLTDDEADQPCVARGCTYRWEQA